MASGFIIETNVPLDTTTIGEGIYWTGGEWGIVGSRIALKAYACPKFGNARALKFMIFCY